MFGAMWSEHCAYKHSRPLLGRLPEATGASVLVGPGENAGAIDIGDGLAVVFKVESHNHPSAVEPYQGAATGVGGIIRDIFTMGARPIALLNSLRFGPLEAGAETDAETAARNRYLFGGVVAGSRATATASASPTSAERSSSTPPTRATRWSTRCASGIARHDEITLARAGGAGNVLLLVGATTGRDGIQGASFASANLGEGQRGATPGGPGRQPVPREAAHGGLPRARPAGRRRRDAGPRCGGAHLRAGGADGSRRRSGAEVDLDAVPRREAGMSPYEVLLSESQERMLIVVRPDRVGEVQAVFHRYGLAAADIGRIVDEPVIRARSGGELVCRVGGRSLADDAPRYAIAGRAAGAAADDLEDLAREPISARHPARVAGFAERARPKADLAALRPHERHQHRRRPWRWGCRRAAYQGNTAGAGADHRWTVPGAHRRARPVPCRPLGGPRGGSQRGHAWERARSASPTA